MRPVYTMWAMRTLRENGREGGKGKDGREDMVVAEEDVSKSGCHLITPMRLQLHSVKDL